MFKLKNLLTGENEELTLSGSVGKVLWVIVSVLLFAFAQNVLGYISRKTKLDTGIDPIITNPAAAYAGPMYNVH